MKLVLILAIASWSIKTLGQIPTNKTNGVIIDSSNGLGSDTNLKVVYTNNNSQISKPAFFLNGKLVNEVLLRTLNPTGIENVNVVKDNIKIDNIQYYGQIHITTKISYALKLISLTDLKHKYTNLKHKSIVFMIDGDVINADYDMYIVDENYLLTIIVDKIENTKEKIDLVLIKLLTKSQANIEKLKEIRIKGREVAFEQ
jgi:hypothetical protein